MSHLNDTIVALSSAPPAGGGLWEVGRAILRLSGPRALEISRAVFTPDGQGTAATGTTPLIPLTLPSPTRGEGVQRPPRAPSAWRRVTGRVAWRGQAVAACAYVMPAPRSYTRQDSVELHLPAVRAVVAETFVALQRAGARAALPGEFTRRALLNGRISLAQAEAVGALIRAQTADEARRWAARAADHAHAGHARLRAEVEALLTELELGLDFSHEDVVLLPRAELLRRIAALLPRAQAAGGSGGASPAGLHWGGEPRAVLAGPTNAGKSTLFNALLERPAAIVSPAAHTTRDPVEALWEAAPGVRLVLADTAGLEDVAQPPSAVHLLPTAEGGWATNNEERAAAGELLSAAQEATRRAVRSADLLLIVLERDAPAQAGGFLRDLERVLAGRVPPVVALAWTKGDLDLSAEATEWTAAFEAELVRRLGAPAQTALTVAARDGQGVAELRAFLSREASALRGRLAAAWAAGEAAARAGAERAAAALTRAEAAARDGLGEDAIAVELREAVHALSDAQGVLLRHDALTEALLDRIFSRFCVGK